MVQSFIYLSAHRTYVLHLYRRTLRNTSKHCHSIHLHSRIRKVLKDVLFKHRYDKSSWSVYSLLQKMTLLNNLLDRGEIKDIWSMLTHFSGRKSVLKNLPVTKTVKQLQKVDISTNAPSTRERREAHILASYIRRNQQRGRLPHHIPDEYKMKLLLPMALHENDVLRLSRIQHQLLKGPPKSVLTYTAAAGSRVWFVRSAINKGKRQSKALGTLLRQEKKKAQKRLNDLEKCETNAVWAIHEAIWEQILEDGTVLDNTPQKYLHSMDKSLDDNNFSNEAHSRPDCPPKVFEWLSPIKDAMNALMNTNTERSSYYKDYKNRVLLDGGQVDFFQTRTDKMYANRVRRFDDLVKNELPLAVPYIAGRDLGSLLAKYRL